MDYFTSDWHISHRNIVGEAVSSWKKGYRTFSSVEEHDQHILEAINKTVKKEDTLYFLGDFTFKGTGLIRDFLDKLKVENVIWILGNHDNIGHKLNKRQFIKGQSCLDFLHPKIKCLREYLEYKYTDKETSLARKAILCHYPLAVWNGCYKGDIHLHGHSHNTYNVPNGKILDVGIDSAYQKLGEYRPFSFTEVLQFMKDRKIVAIDHHNKDTND